MCTASEFLSNYYYFGRNFDYEISYNEKVTVTPRNFPLPFKLIDDLDEHFAFIGITVGVEEYPLYYDACNEKGLAIAGLNFDGYADYKEPVDDMVNIAPFELIPYILGTCSSVSEVKDLIENLNIVDINFSDSLPNSPLHWMIGDKKECIVLESLKDGLKFYDNPVGVMTNNPSFDVQLFNLNNYRCLSNDTPSNNFGDINLDVYSRGMGALGLPGDLSSMSRFVKVAFTKLNSVVSDDDLECISQFFHILASVEQQRGCTLVGEDAYEITLYSSCMNTDKGVYYYKTYDNSQINGVDMYKEDLDSKALINYPLSDRENINMIN